MVGQLKNHEMLPQELVQHRFSLLNALEQVCAIPWYGVGCACGETFLQTEIRDGRMDSRKEISMYFYLSVLTGSGRK